MLFFRLTTFFFPGSCMPVVRQIQRSQNQEKPLKYCCHTSASRAPCNQFPRFCCTTELSTVRNCHPRLHPLGCQSIPVWLTCFLAARPHIWQNSKHAVFLCNIIWKLLYKAIIRTWYTIIYDHFKHRSFSTLRVQRPLNRLFFRKTIVQGIISGTYSLRLPTEYCEDKKFDNVSCGQC